MAEIATGDDGAELTFDEADSTAVRSCHTHGKSAIMSRA